MEKHFRIDADYTCLIGVLAVLLIFSASCSSSSLKNDQADESKSKPNPKPAIIKKPSSSYNDTLLIVGKSAVFYTPDSLQMEKIKSVNKKDIFAMIDHDCFYQMKNARAALKESWPQIQVIDVSKSRYLLFVKNDKTNVCIDLNEKNDICGVLLFDGKKNPALADMPNIETILRIYFSN